MGEPICVLENIVSFGAGEVKHYVGTLKSDVAEGITQVLVFEKSKKNYTCEITELEGQEGYQRSANSGRQSKFGKYITNEDAIVPPIILNCRGEWEFICYDAKFPDYGKLNIRGRANIIDGQHRLGGYIKEFRENGVIRNIDFVGYTNFDMNKEKYVFDTINTQQKGVSPSLSSIIHSEIWQNRVSRRLAEESSSPFCGKISMAGNPGPQYLWKLNAVAKNIERTFVSGAFMNTSEDSKYEIVTQVWQIISDAFPDEWEDIDRGTREREYKMLELTGLIAWSYILSNILSQAYNAVDDTVNWDSVKQRVELFAGRIDWSKDGEFKGQTGEYGGKQIARAMELILAQGEAEP